MNAYTTASLYVGDLHPDVTEALLFELFNAVGPVASIRVCRDSVTRRSLGYAYVNFHSVVDAERALETMNYTLIKDKPTRIMWCHRDPSIRRSGSGNVFIKNLDKSIDNKALYDTFSAFGNILSCKVVTDNSGSSLGYGFVHYETGEAAELAIAKVNGMLLNDKQVYVGEFIQKKDRSSPEADEVFTNVFAKNLPETISEADMRKMFEAFGIVQNCVVMQDEENVSRGFGFINFENHQDAAKAVEELNEKEIDGKIIFVGRAQKKSEREKEMREKFEKSKIEREGKYQGVNLYVKNLDDTVTDEKLREEFAPYGTISSAKVMVDDKGSCKGFGFVCFSTPEEATKAVTEMNGKLIENKPLYVSLAQRKTERQQMLESQHQQRGSRMNRPDGAGGVSMYPGGSPYFFPPAGQQNVPPQMRQQFMYPQQMRWPGQQMMPRPNNFQSGPGNYMMQGGQRGQQSRGRAQGQQNRPAQTQGQGQKMAANPRNQQRGMKYGQGNPRNAGPGPAASSPEALTAAALASAAPEQQKQMLGERLFGLIQPTYPALAGKITGMLLEMDNGELLNLLESPEALNSKVSEAIQVLQTHEAAADSEPNTEAQ